MPSLMALGLAALVIVLAIGAVLVYTGMASHTKAYTPSATTSTSVVSTQNQGSPANSSTQNRSVAGNSKSTSKPNATTTIASAPTNSTNAINASLSPNPVTADWHGNVTTYVDGNYLVVKSTDQPTEHGTFPNKNNPNYIGVQNFTFLIPLHPQISANTAPIPIGGAIGIALNGVPFFGPYTASPPQVAVGNEIFDQCNGHPDMDDVYHYHEFSPCIVNSTPGQHSPLIGFAFDGFPIYGPDGANGIPVPQNSLDSCNGHYDSEVGSYVYVATNSFPFLLGCYEGDPVKSDLGAN